jgi:ArsR family transcriptional regulator, arsenate/arsenite/antimonite-responsive transcriptional repressor
LLVQVRVARLHVPKRNPLTHEQIRLIAKALADGRRLEILKQVGSRKTGIACAEVRECQTITAATLSHHVKELEMAGLISVVRKGKFAEFSLRREVLQGYLDYLKTIF